MPERTILPGAFDQRIAERQAALKEMTLGAEAEGGKPWQPGNAAQAALDELRRGRAREGATASAYGGAAGVAAPLGGPTPDFDFNRTMAARQQAYYSALNSITGPLAQQLSVAEADTWTSFQQYLDETLEQLQYGGGV